MKKIIRLTESDMIRLVKRVIKEQVFNPTDTKSMADKIKAGVGSFGNTNVETLNQALTFLVRKDFQFINSVYKILGITSMVDYLDDEFMAYKITKHPQIQHDVVGKHIFAALGGKEAQKILSMAKKLDDRFRTRK
jgi:hypothetical protein